jgi:hypothetical protein
MLPSFLPLLLIVLFSVGAAAAGQGHDDRRTMEEFAGFFPASDEDGASPLRVDSESLQRQVNEALPAFPLFRGRAGWLFRTSHGRQRPRVLCLSVECVV